MGVDHFSRRDRPDDVEVGEAAGRAAAQAAGAFPVAVAEPREVAVGVPDYARFRLPASEVEGHDARDAWIECGRYACGIAAAGHRTHQNDAVLVDARLLKQHIDAAQEVPRHPAHEAVADARELQVRVEPEEVILATHAVRLVEVHRGVEVVVAAFAVAELIGHEYRGARAGPRHAHVLQFAVGLRSVVGVCEDDARHLLRRLRGKVEVRAHPEPRSRFIHDVVNREAFTLKLASGRDPHVLRHVREGAERFSKFPDAFVAVLFPLLLRGDGSEGLALAEVRFLHPATDIRTHHLGTRIVRPEDVRVEVGEIRSERSERERNGEKCSCHGIEW